MRHQRLHPLAIALLLGSALGWSAVKAPGQEVDAANAAMKREVAAKKKEQDANFKRLDKIPPLGAPAVVGGGVVLPAGQPNMEPTIRMYIRQFRSELLSQYQLLLTVCATTRDQRREIARAGETSLKAAATEVAEWQFGKRQIVAGQRTNQPDPRKLIQEALVAAAKEHLSAAQVAANLDEVELREADVRRTMIGNLVVKFDRFLFLSPDQRAKLLESLTEHWDDAWCRSFQEFMNDDSYFPQIPDKYVVSLFTPSQRKVWQTTQKVSRGGWNLVGGVLEDRPLEDAELEPDGALQPRAGAR